MKAEIGEGGLGWRGGGAKGQFDRASKETSTVRWKTGWREVREVKKVRRSEGRCVCGGKHTHINPSASEKKRTFGGRAAKTHFTVGAPQGNDDENKGEGPTWIRPAVVLRNTEISQLNQSWLQLHSSTLAERLS